MKRYVVALALLACAVVVANFYSRTRRSRGIENAAADFMARLVKDVANSGKK